MQCQVSVRLNACHALIYIICCCVMLRVKRNNNVIIKFSVKVDAACKTRALFMLFSLYRFIVAGV